MLLFLSAGRHGSDRSGAGSAVMDTPIDSGQQGSGCVNSSVATRPSKKTGITE